MPEDRAKQYLEFFSSCDLQSISEMLADGVTLRDWEVSLRGKEAILEFNKGLFDSFSMELTIVNTISSDSDVAIEFELTLKDEKNPTNDDIFLLVTDILSFNREGKINSIIAYRGN